MMNFSAASEKERQLTAEAQGENKKMKARIQELEQEVCKCQFVFLNYNDPLSHSLIILMTTFILDVQCINKA
jgi:hypothetical protein